MYVEVRELKLNPQLLIAKPPNRLGSLATSGDLTLIPIIPWVCDGSGQPTDRVGLGSTLCDNDVMGVGHLGMRELQASLFDCW